MDVPLKISGDMSVWDYSVSEPRFYLQTESGSQIVITHFSGQCCRCDHQFTIEEFILPLKCPNCDREKS